jgi:hypothetical protein
MDERLWLCRIDGSNLPNGAKMRYCSILPMSNDEIDRVSESRIGKSQELLVLHLGGGIIRSPEVLTK